MAKAKKTAKKTPAKAREATLVEVAGGLHTPAVILRQARRVVETIARLNGDLQALKTQMAEVRQSKAEEEATLLALISDETAPADSPLFGDAPE